MENSWGGEKEKEFEKKAGKDQPPDDRLNQIDKFQEHLLSDYLKKDGASATLEQIKEEYNDLLKLKEKDKSMSEEEIQRLKTLEKIFEQES